MYLTIIILVVILLLGIVVAINFADSDVPKSVRLIVSSIIMIILATGIYYLTTPVSTITSASVENRNDSLLNTDTLAKQKEKPVEKENEPVDYPQEKNIEPPIIKPDIVADARDEPADAGDETINARDETGDAGNETVNTRDTSIEQTEITSTQEDLKNTVDIVKEYGKYKVKSKAYFHNKPDQSTRRRAYIIHWNNAVLTPSNEQDGFIYITFTNHLGQTSKGWLLKSDLKRVEEE